MGQPIGCKYRVPAIITNSSTGDVTDCVVEIAFPRSKRYDQNHNYIGGEPKWRGTDIRLTDEEGERLPCWTSLKSQLSTSGSYFCLWTKIPQLAGSEEKKIYIWWGSPQTLGNSAEEELFPVFQDFWDSLQNWVLSDSDLITQSEDGARNKCLHLHLMSSGAFSVDAYKNNLWPTSTGVVEFDFWMKAEGEVQQPKLTVLINKDGNNKAGVRFEQGSLYYYDNYGWHIMSPTIYSDWYNFRIQVDLDADKFSFWLYDHWGSLKASKTDRVCANSSHTGDVRVELGRVGWEEQDGYFDELFVFPKNTSVSGYVPDYSAEKVETVRKREKYFSLWLPKTASIDLTDPGTLMYFQLRLDQLQFDQFERVIFPRENGTKDEEHDYLGDGPRSPEGFIAGQHKDYISGPLCRLAELTSLTDVESRLNEAQEYYASSSGYNSTGIISGYVIGLNSASNFDEKKEFLELHCGWPENKDRVFAGDLNSFDGAADFWNKLNENDIFLNYPRRYWSTSGDAWAQTKAAATSENGGFIELLKKIALNTTGNKYIVETIRMVSEEDGTYRRPNLEELRFQALASIAYGSKGLCVYPFDTTDVSGEDGLFELIGGHTLETWREHRENVGQIISEAKSLSSMLSNAELNDWSVSTSGLSWITSVDHPSTSGSDDQWFYQFYLVEWIVDDTDRKYVIISRNPYEELKATFHFDANHPYIVHQNVEGQRLQSGYDNKVTIEFLKGEARVLELTS